MTKSAILVSKDKLEIREVEKPTAGRDQVLVKVHAAALNPTDLKHIEGGYPVVLYGNAVGCDYAGVVEAVGPGAEDVRRKGERIAGIVHGVRYPNSSAWSEYAVADARLAFSLPDSLAFEDAASLGIAGLTACQMLYQSQSLPTPDAPAPSPGPWLLVWSGASAVGQYVIQLGALAGLRVIATASKKHDAFLKSLGAVATFNYRDADVGKQIHDFTKGELAHVADCLSSLESLSAINDAVGTKGGQVSTIVNVDTSSLRGDITATRSVAYELLGKEMPSPYPAPARPELYAKGLEYVALISKLLVEGKLKTTPVKLFHGLEGIPEGLEYMRAGKVSGEKVTFKIV